MKLAILLSVVFLLLVTVGCNDVVEEEECEFAMEFSEIFEKQYHASRMHFFNYPRMLGFEGFSAIVFVHSEEEAVGFPDDVSVTWPTEITQRTVVLINREIRRSEIDLTELGLTFPITTYDMVENWEKIDILTRPPIISEPTWRVMRSTAWRLTTEEWESRLHYDKELHEIQAIIEAATID